MVEFLPGLLHSVAKSSDMYVPSTTPMLSLSDIESMEESFVPNILNTCVFIVSSALTLCTFLVNYQGHPFMQSLRENKPLLYAIAGGYAFLIAVTMGMGAEEMQLVQIPFDMQTQILGLMTLDVIVCYAWEKLCDRLFGKNAKRRFV